MDENGSKVNICLSLYIRLASNWRSVNFDLNPLCELHINSSYTAAPKHWECFAESRRGVF